MTKISYTRLISNNVSKTRTAFWKITFLLAIGLILMIPQSPLKAQYTKVNAGFMGAMQGTAAWGDYDNDGDPDVIVTGTSEEQAEQEMPVSIIYRNDGGTFTNIQAGLMGVRKSGAAWGDYDADGDLDLALSGYNDADEDTALIYKNMGNDNFMATDIYVDGATNAAIDWGDANNDGHLDLIVTGRTDPFNIIFESIIYINEGNDSFSQINAGLEEMEDGSVHFADYDNDGDNDLLLTGEFEAWVYENDGSGTFSKIDTQPLGVNESDSDWGDFDNDGDLDFALAGETSTLSDQARIYEQEAPGEFDVVATDIQGVHSGTVEWSDANGDGNLDLLVMGIYNSEEWTFLYTGDGNGNFSQQPVNIQGYAFCDADWADYDNDGDPDLLVSGRDTSWMRKTVIYKKTGAIGNIGNEISSEPEVTFEIFPNPLDENSVIRYDLPSKIQTAKIVVFDENGKELKNYKVEFFPEGTLPVDLSDLSTGISYFTLILNDKITVSRKVLIE